MEIAADAVVWSAVVAGIVSVVANIVLLPARHFLDRKLLGHQVRLEVGREQRLTFMRSLAALRPRVILAAVTLNDRLLNLYDLHEEAWLAVQGDYRGDHYYFRTTVHRLLALLAWAQLTEEQGASADRRFVPKEDRQFIGYMRALLWPLTGRDLLSGLEYDWNESTDHFFRGELQADAERVVRNDRVINELEFKRVLDRSEDEAVPRACAFIDGISPSEQRYRWSLLVVLHLIALAFLHDQDTMPRKTTRRHMRTAQRSSLHRRFGQTSSKLRGSRRSRTPRAFARCSARYGGHAPKPPRSPRRPGARCR